MTADAIAVSRRPATKQDAGAALCAMKADIKADLARLEVKVTRMETKFNIGLALLVAMSVAILTEEL